jgi:hypothetical protein
MPQPSLTPVYTGNPSIPFHKPFTLLLPAPSLSPHPHVVR